MADEPEKTEALKKVYAEMIRNTAEEAAARALESELKALRIHHDLCNTKDEAIRMLLRFKQLIDVKKTEAERTDLSQQNRIKELDAQLNETEGVIIDLRAEIRNARERLEEMKNIHIRATERNLVDEKSISEEKELNIKADGKKSEKCAQFLVDSENKEIKNINGLEAFSINNRVVSEDQTVKRHPKSVGYAQSNHKLSRFGREKLNLKEKSSVTDAKLTKNDEHIACTLRRSIRKRKVRCWDEISSLFNSRASLSHCKKRLVNDGVKFEETNIPSDSLVEKHESAANESDGVACNTDNNRCLKYTFSRRRKKVLSSKSDNCSSHENTFLTGQIGEKPSFHHENKKLNVIDDSSSDSQNMFDIACQLISLSAKRSW